MRRDGEKAARESFSLKSRFRYWFDNRMARGAFGLILALVAGSVLLAVCIAALIVALGFGGEAKPGAVLWDGVATVINAWMPSFEDGGPGYLVMMSLIALAGLLFTSVLIGIITSAIEVRIDSLKKGNSRVLERDHIVVLGFYPGEYALLEQLIRAAAGEPACIVVAEDMAREEMEQAIGENIDIPKNCRIVCRTADITDPAALEKCSVETCRTVIVSPTDDMRTIKAVLAVSKLLDEKGVPEIGVNAIISRPEYRFPPSLVEADNITTLQTNAVLAKLIAHACTQTGISACFQEIFNFEGAEFYLTTIDGIDGMTFGDVTARLEGGVPVGVLRDGEIALNPGVAHVLNKTDRILVFSEERDSARLGAGAPEPLLEVEPLPLPAGEGTGALIFGHNETLPVILRELPVDVNKVCIVSKVSQDEREALDAVASDRSLFLRYAQDEVGTEAALLALARSVEHVVILNRHELEPEEADMEAIFLLLNLRDIRARYGLRFNITVEMQREHNQKLVSGGDHTDFIVSSSVSSLILAQLAENPELYGVFKEILSNAGNEIYIKNAAQMRLTGRHTVRALRRRLLERGYILLGWLDEGGESRFNPPLDAALELTQGDGLIVLGEL